MTETLKLSPALILEAPAILLSPPSPAWALLLAPAAHTTHTSHPATALCLFTQQASDMIQSFRGCCENSGSATTSLPSWTPWQGPSRDSHLSPVPRASRTSPPKTHQTPSSPAQACLLPADSQVSAFGPGPPNSRPACGPTCLPSLITLYRYSDTYAAGLLVLPKQVLPHLAGPEAVEVGGGRTTIALSSVLHSTLKLSLLSTTVPSLAPSPSPGSVPACFPSSAPVTKADLVTPFPISPDASPGPDPPNLLPLPP